MTIATLSQHNQSYLRLNQRRLSKMESAFHFSGSDQRMSSQMRITEHSFAPSIHSAPDIKGPLSCELLIVVPKTLPFYSLLNRYVQDHSLLVYHSLDQLRYLTKHLEKHYYAAVIVDQSEHSKAIHSLLPSNLECLVASELGERKVR